MSARLFHRSILALLDRMVETQLPEIRRAGQVVAEAIGTAHRVWLPATSHCHHDEATDRIGGFLAAHVLSDYFAIEPGDAVIAATSAGRFTVAIDSALMTRARGAKLIALAFIDFERSPDAVHYPAADQPFYGELRLGDLADITVDLGGPVGDGVMLLLNTGVRILPSSGVLDYVAMWMVFSEAVAALVEHGKAPMTYRSRATDETRATNRWLVEEYRRTRVGYELIQVTDGAAPPPPVDAARYYEAVRPLVVRLLDDEVTPITQAGVAIAESIANGHRVWVAQTAHGLAGEAATRAGGFFAAHILDDPIAIEAGDTVIVGTNRGRLEDVVAVAQIAKRRGAGVVLLSQIEGDLPRISASAGLMPSRLSDLADVVVDLGGSEDDGVAILPVTRARIMPSSGVTAITAMWMIFSEAYARLIDRGMTPLMYQSVILHGATKRNELLAAEYQRTRLGYHSETSA